MIFQIWIFQEDSHLELHFGKHQTDPGTYGYPVATNDPDPGPSIKFTFDDCSNVLSYYFNANNPSYDFFNMCIPTYSFIDGTPNKGITYILTDNTTTVTGLSANEPAEFSLYPNPSSDFIHIVGVNQVQDIGTVQITDIFGRVVREFSQVDLYQPDLTLDIRSLSPGVYSLGIKTENSLRTGKFVKTASGNLH
ncbi:MAG: hypothetical protein Kow00127_07810 [Bacteroidales bacterium]